RRARCSPTPSRAGTTRSRPGTRARAAATASFAKAGSGSRRETPAIPLGLHRPVSRPQRANLEGLWQSVDVEAQPHRGLVTRALDELIERCHLPRVDARQEPLDLVEPAECRAQETEGDRRPGL